MNDMHFPCPIQTSALYIVAEPLIDPGVEAKEKKMVCTSPEINGFVK
jgi:hypothetical protein